MEYVSVDAICPFYKAETKNTIRCEGIISVGLTNSFENAEIKKTHLREYCCNKYRDCPIALETFKKYN